MIIPMIEFGPGDECADEIFPDDGRSSDGEDHGGDWGSHGHSDWIADNIDIDYGQEDV